MQDSTPRSSEELALPERYALRGFIGRGGTAAVYRVLDRQTGDEVALKVLRPEFTGAVAVERFLREIRVNSELVHPCIVPLLDSGHIDGLPYLVMPIAQGGSLRDRLRREGPLPLSDVVRIGRDIAAALDAAHALGVVHRDVKPENILLTEDRALLGDFGIARALLEAARTTLTDSGIAIGTAGYMSPEQSSQSHQVDRRSDVYSLGAVVYEMLAGEPPFTGPSAQAIIAKHLSQPLPDVTVVRDMLPEAVAEVLRKAMAKVPVDRYPSAGELAADIERAAGTPPSPRSRWLPRTRRRKAWLGAAVPALLVVAVSSRYVVDAVRGGTSAAAADTATYLVLPPAGAGPVASADILRSMRRWTGLQSIDVADDGAERPLRPRDAARQASAREAGRFVMTEQITGPTATRLRMRVFDTGVPDRPLAVAEGTVRNGAADSVLAILVDSLLLRPTDPSAARAAHAGGTRSLPARQANARGHAALLNWDLAAARSAFAAATQYDPDYADALLHLALTDAWLGVEVPRWRIFAEQATAGRSRLSPDDQRLVDAVGAMARRDVATSCARWRDVVAADTLDGMAWFGLAHCEVSDSAVVADGSSPSGWRFRTSYYHALRAYQRSFELHPPILASFGRDGLQGLRRLFKTTGNQLRSGRSATGRVFSSNMEWRGDTLAFIPYPYTGEHVLRRTDAMATAMRRQRELVRQIAASWVTASPASAPAWLALAEAMSMLGDVSALDTLARARARAETPNELFRVAATEAALQLGFAIRDGDTTRVRRVRTLADSLLAAADSAANPRVLGSLAALTGRAGRAAAYASHPTAAAAIAVPTEFRTTVPPLLVYAALGGPADTLLALERVVSQQIQRLYTASEQPRRRLEFLGRAATMAFPSHRFVGLEQLAQDGDPIASLQLMTAAGNQRAVREGLARLRQERRPIPPEDLTIDALAPEAALLIAVGDSDQVAAWLDPTLESLPMFATVLLSNPIQSASLASALLHRRHAATAPARANFADAAIRILWSDADPFIRRRVDERHRPILAR